VFIIIGTHRQRRKLTHFFPTNILSHSVAPSDIVRNLGVTFDSDFNFRKHISVTCRSCFYHIRDLRRIRIYISLSVAKTIATALITSRIDYCNSLLYDIASGDILKLMSHFWNLFTGSLFNLASFSTVHYCLSNSDRLIMKGDRLVILTSLHPEALNQLQFRANGSIFWAGIKFVFA
jgi:hypothetical protein